MGLNQSPKIYLWGEQYAWEEGEEDDDDIKPNTNNTM